MENKICQGCANNITGPYIQVEDKFYDQKCFNCTSCKKPITSKFEPNGGFPLCLDCLEKCACGCGQPFNITLPNGNKYNKDCVKCKVCNKPIESEYAEIKGKFTCVGCLDKCTCGCNQTIAGKFSTLSDGSKYIFGHVPCSVCGKNIDTEDFVEKQGKPLHITCGNKCDCGCNQPLSSTGYTELPDGKKINLGCLNCQECHKTITSPEYYILMDKIICAICKVKHTKICHNCKQPCSEDHVHVLDKSYHKKCFTCGKCNKLIETEQIGQREPLPGQPVGDPLCLECNGQKMRMSTSQVMGIKQRLSNVYAIEQQI